jgi:hypothetical protein
MPFWTKVLICFPHRGSQPMPNLIVIGASVWKCIKKERTRFYMYKTDYQYFLIIYIPVAPLRHKFYLNKTMTSH